MTTESFARSRRPVDGLDAPSSDGLGRGRLGSVTAELRSVAPALLAYAAVRAVGVLIVVLWGAHRGDPGLHALSTLWDAIHYQTIAERGYARAGSIPGPHGPYEMYAFFPGYPALTRCVWSLLPVTVHQAALLVAQVASLAAVWGIFKVTELLYGRRTGVITAVLWGVTPVAVVESMAYSELLFTAFAAWAVYAAVTRRWVWAGLLAVLAGLTRPAGSAVAAAVAGAALWQLWQLRTRRPGPGEDGPAWWRPVLGALVAPLGVLGYLGWVALVKGHWNAYFKIQEAWQSKFDYGSGTLHTFGALLSTSGTVWLAQVVVAMVLVASLVLFGVCLIQRQPAPLLLLSAGILLLALGDAAYFNSRARFLLPAFGLLLPLACGLARLRSRATTVLILSSAALASGIYGGYVVFVYPDAP